MKGFIKYFVFCAAMIFLFSCAKSGEKKKVIVLAFDGMDPRIVRSMFEKGKLPNLKKLARTGDFKDLWSSVPPQSPVAWANFITGKNPGGHAIFDFIHRDPSTIVPYLSISKIEPPPEKLNIWGIKLPNQIRIPFTEYVVPLTGAKTVLLREGKAFWEYLSEEGIPATIFKIPSNYPPVESGEAVSGMGTPDLFGSYGIYQYFTTDPSDIPEDYSGARMQLVEEDGGAVRAAIEGPKNTFLEDQPTMEVPFTARIDPENPVAGIELPDRKVILNEGEWSDWLVLSFKPLPLLPATTGTCRLYLKEAHPDFKLYVTPLNVDPKNPALPIDWPEGFARRIADNAGYFYTQGMPEDTKALTNNTFTTEEFYVQSRMVLKERNRLFDYLFGRFREGFLFFYYSSTDQGSHIFWHLRDKNHPVYDPVAREKLGDVIEQIYDEMDKVVGKVLARLDENTTFIIMSDHGFAPLYKNFHLNTWLADNGYLTLKHGKETGSLLAGDVDWSRTRAYALGLNGLYVNLRGREGEGIVPPGAERDRLVDELVRKLSEVKDPETGGPVIKRVHRREEIYRGPYMEEAPDLLVGYDWGYRTSWESALGDVTENLLTVSEEKWSGDHCGATEVVPGVLFSNKKLNLPGPHLYDITPSILTEFGVPVPEDMIGNNIFEPRDRTEKLKSLDYI